MKKELCKDPGEECLYASWLHIWLWFSGTCWNITKSLTGQELAWDFMIDVFVYNPSLFFPFCFLFPFVRYDHHQYCQKSFVKNWIWMDTRSYEERTNERTRRVG
ncbi:hypothetical protein F4677DRAFT_291405 [Hypoxylon crocopeplum]|nr:hypothetical protein F4677DRAFT_291405 [Hypoxylon crocopeplum]